MFRLLGDELISPARYAHLELQKPLKTPYFLERIASSSGAAHATRPPSEDGAAFTVHLHDSSNALACAAVASQFSFPLTAARVRRGEGAKTGRVVSA
jgi:hypothetical protein